MDFLTNRTINKQLLISIIIFICLVIATIAVVLYGKGYRFGLGEGKIELKGTGLLVAKSLPDGAQVLIDGKLKTATDNTINLPPGQYRLTISKEGYFPWEKRIRIQTEVVTRTEALLIPTAPKLESISDVGARNPVIDPTLTKIAFAVASQSAIRNGIYVFDMKSNPLLTLQGSSTQIVDDSLDFFSESKISWSPDGKDIIATVSAASPFPTTYLLDTDRVNSPPFNITSTLPSVDATWTRIRNSKQKAVLDSFPRPVRGMAGKDFTVLSFSPDLNKILYQASRSATLPVVIKPRLIGVNSTPETRSIEQGQIYVYDVKEDRNYKMDSNNFNGSYSWFTDSKHIIFVRDHELRIIDFDGLNDTTVYAGPFIENYIFPWADATRIVILTNLGNSRITPNLYTISLK